MVCLMGSGRVGQASMRGAKSGSFSNEKAKQEAKLLLGESVSCCSVWWL